MSKFPQIIEKYGKAGGVIIKGAESVALFGVYTQKSASIRYCCFDSHTQEGFGATATSFEGFDNLKRFLSARFPYMSGGFSEFNVFNQFEFVYLISSYQTKTKEPETKKSPIDDPKSEVPKTKPSTPRVLKAKWTTKNLLRKKAKRNKRTKVKQKSMKKSLKVKTRYCRDILKILGATIVNKM